MNGEKELRRRREEKAPGTEALALNGKLAPGLTHPLLGPASVNAASGNLLKALCGTGNRAHDLSPAQPQKGVDSKVRHLYIERNSGAGGLARFLFSPTMFISPACAEFGSTVKLPGIPKVELASLSIKQENDRWR